MRTRLFRVSATAKAALPLALPPLHESWAITMQPAKTDTPQPRFATTLYVLSFMIAPGRGGTKQKLYRPLNPAQTGALIYIVFVLAAGAPACHEPETLHA